MKLNALSTILAAIQGKQTPKSNSKINIKIDEFEENPHQRELRFDAVDHPAEYSWLQCRDYPDWKDAMNHTCADMAEIIQPGDLDGYLDDSQMYDDEDYDEKFDYCSFFGGYYDEENTAGVRVLCFS